MPETNVQKASGRTCCFCLAPIVSGNLPFHESCIPKDVVSFYCLGCTRLRRCAPGDLSLIDQINSQIVTGNGEDLVPRQCGQLLMHTKCAKCSDGEVREFSFVTYFNSEIDPGESRPIAVKDNLPCCHFCGEAITDFNDIDLPFHEICLPRDRTTFYCECGQLYLDEPGSFHSLTEFNEELRRSGADEIGLSLGLCVLISACKTCDPDEEIRSLSYMVIYPTPPTLN